MMPSRVFALTKPSYTILRATGSQLYLPLLQVRPGGHVAGDGLLEPPLDVAAGLAAVPDHIEPFRDVEVVGVHQPAAAIGIEEPTAGEVLGGGGGYGVQPREARLEGEHGTGGIDDPLVDLLLVAGGLDRRR